MYINEVIDNVEAYYPHEYNRLEMYRWCDEVSAMLKQESLNTYKEINLRLADDNTILLPEGVDIERVYEIRAGNRIIPKTDLRTYQAGTKLSDRHGGGIIIPKPPRKVKQVKVIYLAPYENIRTVKYSGEITLEDEAFLIPNADFRIGDTVTITILDSDGNVQTDADGNDMRYRTDIFEREYDTDADLYRYGTTEIGATAGTYSYAKATRYVTDRTVCDSPYDTMYIDYIMARIAQYQRDTEMQSLYRIDFNSKLSAYRDWLAEKIPRDTDRIENWW